MWDWADADRRTRPLASMFRNIEATADPERDCAWSGTEGGMGSPAVSTW